MVEIAQLIKYESFHQKHPYSDIMYEKEDFADSLLIVKHSTMKQVKNARLYAIALKWHSSEKNSSHVSTYSCHYN